MDMQDKELDKLFRSSLDDLEIEPSVSVWTAIIDRLDAGKRERSLIPFLSIAAGIILLVTTGILFFTKEVKINNNQQAEKIAKNITTIKPPIIVKNSLVATPSSKQNKKEEKAVIAPGKSLIAVNKLKAIKGMVKNTAAAETEQKTTNAKPVDHDDLALFARGNDLQNPVLPGKENGINALTGFENKPELTAVQLPPANKAIAAAIPVKKHRIRSLGDVFNVVIAVVDKREDKIIEFSNTDEDDATITGVNLGIIKVKKEK